MESEAGGFVLVEVGHDDDLRASDVLRLGAQCLEDLVAALLGEHDVEQDEVVVVVARCHEAVCPVDEPVYRVARLAEAAHVHFADEAIVFDDENCLNCHNFSPPTSVIPYTSCGFLSSHCHW